MSKVKTVDQLFKVGEALANFLNNNQGLFLDIQSQKLNSLSDKDITNIHTLSKIIFKLKCFSNLFSEKIAK